MAHILIMPRQGNTVESCVIVNWKVKEGDCVTNETIICEVETDKAVFEIPAGSAGTVLKLLYNEGDDVSVLAPIAVIGNVGEEWETAENREQRTENKDCCSKDNINSIELNPHSSIPGLQSSVPNPQYSISPRARSLAEKEAISIEMVSGTGPGGGIIERDVQTALKKRPALTAAAKAAISDKIPVVGSGIGGRVTVDDLACKASSPQSPVHGPCSSEDVISEIHIKGIKKVISDRMLKSLSETAQYTINASASVEKLQDIRKKLRFPEYLLEEHNDMKITVNDFILFAVSRVLPRFSYMNAHKVGDIINTFERVHLGVAVETPRGLLVPVIRNANLLSLFQISSETKRLAAACKNGSIKPDELSGSTFTVTNLGSLGITSFTPVLNIPEAAILGVCSIEMKPVAADNDANICNSCRFEPHIGFSLTVNHQVVDGAQAARFLKALCETVANIDILLSD